MIFFIFQDCENRSLLELKSHLSLSQAALNIHSECEVPDVIQDSVLPVLLSRHGRLVVVGLASLLRFIVNWSRGSHDSHDSIINGLLGEKANCLKACAEVSPWTYFCEKSFPRMVDEILTMSSSHSDSSDTANVVGMELIQLENYLADISERRHCQQVHRNGSNQVEGCEFLESNRLQLTDLIVFICIELCLHKSVSLQRLFVGLNRVSKWYQNVRALPNVRDTLHSVSVFLSIASLELEDACLELIHSLPKIHLSDGCCSTATDATNQIKPAKPNFHTELKQKFKITQSSVVSVIGKLESSGIRPLSFQSNVGCTRMLWNDLPKSLLLTNKFGGVPEKRTERKLEQLENMVSAVKEIMLLQKKDSPVIVDFCSGCGHLGILLAYLLPHCHVRLTLQI